MEKVLVEKNTPCEVCVHEPVCKFIRNFELIVEKTKKEVKAYLLTMAETEVELRVYCRYFRNKGAGGW